MDILFWTVTISSIVFFAISCVCLSLFYSERKLRVEKEEYIEVLTETNHRLERDLNYFLNTYYQPGEETARRTILRIFASYLKGDHKLVHSLVSDFGSKHIKNKPVRNR